MDKSKPYVFKLSPSAMTEIEGQLGKGSVHRNEDGTIRLDGAPILFGDETAVRAWEKANPDGRNEAQHPV